MNQHFLSSVLGLFVALLPIANSIAVPIFYSLTASDSKAYRQAWQTAINVALVLVAFLLIGRRARLNKRQVDGAIAYKDFSHRAVVFVFLNLAHPHLLPNGK